jgi:membrane dipeptidase
MLSLDGMECCIPDLDDASKYPDIITEMLVRGWSDDDIIGLMGANILRVLDEVDEVAAQLIGEEASAEIYEERTDLPALSVASWGPNLPDVVKEYVAKNAKR